MSVQAIRWLGRVPKARVRLLDQTLLPAQENYLERSDYRLLAEDIRRLAVRGAPAIGVAGAFGVVLGLQEEAGRPAETLRAKMPEVAHRGSSSGTREGSA